MPNAIVTFVALLFQRFWHTFDASLAVELATTSELFANAQAVGVPRTVLRKERELGRVRAFVWVALLLATLRIGRCGQFAGRLNVARRLRLDNVGRWRAATAAAATGRQFTFCVDRRQLLPIV